MLELTSKLGWSRFDVMGYHTGSMTAVEMARLMPESVRKLVLVSAPIFSEEEKKRFRQIYSTDPIWTRDGQRLLDLWQWFQDFVRVDDANTVEYAGKIFYERLSGRENFWWGHNAAFNYDFGAALSAIDNPVLILNPDDDLVRMTPRALPLLRNGHVVELPHFTHGFLDAYPEDVVTIVCSFLDEAVRGPRLA